VDKSQLILIKGSKLLLVRKLLRELDCSQFFVAKARFARLELNIFTLNVNF